MRSLKILIVGHCHPDFPHVCALRTRGFADGLAQQGHKVVLLTGTLPGTQSIASVDNVKHNLPQEIGEGPLVIGCPPKRGRWLSRARRGQFPTLPNKILLAGSFLLHGGIFTDWVEGSKRYWPIIADQWRPDIVWATFGNTGAWLIAQGISTRSSCPWIMDMKDLWEDFIPKPIRGLLAARFSDYAATTALADVHAKDLCRWFGSNPTIIPSGVDIPTDVLGHDIDLASQNTDRAALRISLVGSLYGDTDLKAFLSGVKAWGEDRRHHSVRPAILEYFGDEEDRLLAATRSWENICEVRASGFVDPAELALRLRKSHINAFVNARSGFRHKVLEFVIAGRPIMSFPTLGTDECRIIRESGIKLYNCTTSRAVKSALDDLDQSESPNTAPHFDVEKFSWNSRVSELEVVIDRILR